MNFLNSKSFFLINDQFSETSNYLELEHIEENANVLMCGKLQPNAREIRKVLYSQTTNTRKIRKVMHTTHYKRIQENYEQQTSGVFVFKI